VNRDEKVSPFAAATIYHQLNRKDLRGQDMVQEIGQMRDELTLVRRVFNTSAGTLPKALVVGSEESQPSLASRAPASTSTDDSRRVHPVSR
jgi:hypothetical protein